MVTYRDLVMKCQLLETDIVPSPTLHIKDNKVIYSVPSETGLLARCENATNAPALKIVQLQRPGYHLDNTFYDELQTKVLAHLREHSPLLLNVLPG
jgi:hypothetical protein